MNVEKMRTGILRGAGLLGLGLVFSSLAFPAVSNLRVGSVTATQFTVSFTVDAPGSACTIEVSEAADYSVLVDDVDPAKFTDANLCGRDTSIRVGNHYTVVVGRQGGDAIQTGLSGYSMSRALYADAGFYVRVTNGSSAEIVVRTANIMLGTTSGDKLAVLAPFKYKRVDSNKLVNPMFADPYTGARIINPAATLGYVYASTTAISGVSGCAITIAGTPTIRGSCRFTDATGSNWGATTGTTTDAIQADDNNYATYSGTAQEKLFVRYGTGRFPISDTYGAPGGGLTIASQNLAFRALTSDATGDGGYLKTCFTFDGLTCSSPERRISLTTSEASYIVCHDSPCTIPDNPGDTMVFDQEGTLPGQARIYNVAPNYTTIKFATTNATAACNELTVGEKISAFNSNIMSNPVTLTVAAKDCAASPPEFTSSESQDLTNNSTNGGTYWRYTGFSSQNWNFGILLWKESTTSGSTISVDVPLWRATYATYWRFNSGAGGFGRNCSNVIASDGYTTCMGGYDGNVMYGVKRSADGRGLDFKNYGYGTWRGDQLSGNLTGSGGWSTYTAVPQTSNTNYAPWDDETAGVFYARFGWNGGVANQQAVLTKVTLNLAEKTVTDIDSATDLIFNSPRGPKAGVSAVSILTPCLNTCASASDNKTMTQLKLDFSAEWAAQASRFPSCSIEAVQGKDVYEVCKSGGQDTYAWVFVWDLGNGLPVGSGYVGSHGNTVPIYAAIAVHDTPESRWSPLHTYQSPAKAGGAAFGVLESSGYKCFMSVTGSALSSCSVNGTGTCSACPNVTLDGVNYSGRNWCSDITLSSSDPGGVAEWEDGDPVNAINCESTVKWLQKLEVGDFIRSGSEFIRLIERTNNQQWKAIRGWGYYWDNSIYGPVAHNNGDTWYTHFGTISKDPFVSNPAVTNALYWYPALSVDATNPAYAFLGRGQNHGLNALNAVVAVEAAYSATPADFTDPASVKATFTSQLYSIMPQTFGGKLAFCQGNACEKHPSLSQILASPQQQKSFADIHPVMFTGTDSTNEQPLVAGKSYIRVYSDADEINPKHFDVASFSGPFPLLRQDTITDSPNDSGKNCVAIVADDCFSGSTAGKIYTVNDRMDPSYSNSSQYTCRQVQFASLWGDACTVNANNAGASLSQYEVPTTTSFGNGSRARVLSKIWNTYRQAATENTKAMPDGSAFLNRSHWAVMNLPWPGADLRNRATFQAYPVEVTSVPAGTDNVLVQFGRNLSFQCSRNRDNSCYSESATISETTPYKFDHESLTGLSCASGCVPVIPLMPNRMTYYRVIYRNSGGATIATGLTQVTSVQ